MKTLNKKEKRYVSLDYKLYESKNQEHMLEVDIVEKETEIILRCATMCVYFEDNLINMSKIIWPDKEIRISYVSDIALKFYTYKKFMQTHKQKSESI